MPRSPNDNEKPKPASKPDRSKRDRRTSTPLRFGSAATYGQFWAQCPPKHQQLTETLLRYKPLGMLRYIIKSVLDDRLTKEELKAICTWCYNVLRYWDVWED